jgi:outer membrane protein, multidrug efflux system
VFAPLINKKAIQAEYKTANSRQLQAVYDYQRTVLNAYMEVVNRLSKVENYSRSIEIKKQQLASLEASVDNATKLFQNARAEYVEVLLAQRDFMEAKMVLIETKQQQLAAIVNTYQALGGGGWLPNGLLMSDVDCPQPFVEDIPLKQPDELKPDEESLPAPSTSESEEAEMPLPAADIPLPDSGDSPHSDDNSFRILPPVETNIDVDHLKSVPR